MPNRVINILLVGVGGQGTILASKVLGKVAEATGGEVKLSEIHGMAQRGGSVVTQVRFGPKVYSPVVARGTADFILAFEKLEAMRWLPYLRGGGCLVVNDQAIDPMPVITGAAKYPQGVIEELSQQVKNLTVIDALKVARQCGSAKAVNVVLLGVLARKLGIEQEMWLKALRETVPPRTIEVNEQAFLAGFRRGAV